MQADTDAIQLGVSLETDEFLKDLVTADQKEENKTVDSAKGMLFAGCV
jgi:hypothetical protein